VRRLGALFVLLAALGACSDDDEPRLRRATTTTSSTSSTSTTTPTCQPVPENTEATLEASLSPRDDLRQVSSIVSTAPIVNAQGQPTFIAGHTSDGAIAIFVKLASGQLLAVNDEARNRSTLPDAGNITLDFPGAKQAAGCSIDAR
jgi:hypothetical protein